MLYFLFFWIIPALVLYVAFYKYGHVFARRVGRAQLLVEEACAGGGGRRRRLEGLRLLHLVRAATIATVG